VAVVQVAPTGECMSRQPERASASPSAAESKNSSTSVTESLPVLERHGEAAAAVRERGDGSADRGPQSPAAAAGTRGGAAAAGDGRGLQGGAAAAKFSVDDDYDDDDEREMPELTLYA